jgi:hypothetical protein
MVRNTITTSKVMVTGVFSGERLASIDTITLNETFTQDHFINPVLSDLKKYAQDLRR